MKALKPHLAIAAALLATLAAPASADVITDWSQRADAIITEAKIGTPPAIRVLAIAHTASFDAVNAITGVYPRTGQTPDRGASVDAAVAAAHRATLVKLLPAIQPAIDAAYQASLEKLADGPAKATGIEVGERAAAAVLASRTEGTVSPEASYRPKTTAGVYVPTAPVAAPQWSQRKPWLMSRAAMFRPGPPPALFGAVWARDFNEVKALGSKHSKERSASHAEIAAFWEYSLPAIYHGVVRSVAGRPGRESTRNARLFAAVSQAMDDAMIGVFDAKYFYRFWRPETAIRNGDIDSNSATHLDVAWTPLINAPMHPEYPSAHSILAAAVATVLRAEAGDRPTPAVSTSSPTAKGAVRQWTDFDDFVNEVGLARIVQGVHFRSATEAGAAMGRRIGSLAVSRHLEPPQ